MKKGILFLLILIVMFSCKNNSPENQKGIADYAITNVTLIDGTGNKAAPNTTILIKGEKIFDIVDSNAEIQADSIINGTGKFIIPGIFDNHFHLGEDNDRRLKRMIHFGVTNVFIPGSSFMTYPIVKRLDSIEKTGKVTSPSIKYSSLFVTVPDGHPRGDYRIEGKNIYRLRSEEEIPVIVKEAKENGAIAIKLMIEDGPTPPFIEIIDSTLINRIRKEADKAGLMLFAHIGERKEWKISLEHNVDALMHFTNPSIDWENDMDLVKQMQTDSIYWVTTGMLIAAYTRYPLNPEWLDSEHWKVYDREREELKKNQEKHRQIAISIIENGFRMSVEEFQNGYLKKIASDWRKLDSLGVQMVVGTDGGTPNLYNIPGLNVHKEMQLYQEGGMKPERIIKCASLNAAKMLKIDKDYGSVEIGKIANMLVLDKNPLDDISNTLSINTVLKKGKIQKRITNANNGYK